ASALTIVLISTVGAPILRDSASGFSGLVHYTPPVSPLMQTSLATPNREGYRVGTGPVTNTRTPVLRAELPRPMYLRSFVYGAYQQGTWLPLIHSAEMLNQNGYPPHDLALSTIVHPFSYRFKIEPLQVGNPNVPIPGELLSLAPESNAAYYMNLGGSLVSHVEFPYPVCEGEAEMSSDESALDAADPQMGRLIPEYMQTAAIPEEVVAYAKEVSKGAHSDYAKATAILQAIEQNEKYNLNAAATPLGKDPVSYFLFESHEGYCDLFASSMTLMARAVGLPARYVTGYYPFDRTQDSEGRYVVKQDEAHAWCEIFFRKGGWVVFDATEGAAEVAGGERGTANDRPFWQAGWFIVTVVFAAAGLAGYVGYLGLGALQRLRRTWGNPERLMVKAQARLRTQLRRQYLAFEHEVRRSLGRPRRAGETILEYTGAAEGRLLHRAGVAKETGLAFVSVFYAPRTLDAAGVEELTAKVRAFKQTRRSSQA
ncbi:MAG TPA: transglutaminase domain-containing protein, partial [Fimbriimonadaceae bacterium]|nr:transglutaminase domain-containing protein [Fimbriimonadaceae bacterium]